MNSGCAIGSHKGVMFCTTCHENKPTVENPSLRHSENPSKICRECHAYNNAADHHPSSITSDSPEGTIEIDSEFHDMWIVDKQDSHICTTVCTTLFDGKMECLACHRIHVEGYRNDSKNFLVGGPYTYENRRELCFKCHRRDAYEGVNPHKIMLNEDNELIESTCLICHTKTPDPQVDTLKDVKFRASVAFLCWRCHLPMVGEFLGKHFLRTPTKRQLVDMRRSGTWFPLDPLGRLTCSTCHNPHQPGVLLEEFGQGTGEKFRLRDKRICGGCHDMK
ncbi:MAG: hypothetical protein IMF07_09325 [Proteobacteria bacterium]|nr:hypothetical protein [Pseudomonadota bacterium]